VDVRKAMMAANDKTRRIDADTGGVGRRLVWLFAALMLLGVLAVGGAQAAGQRNDDEQDDALMPGAMSYFEPFGLTRVYLPTDNARLMSIGAVAPLSAGRPPIRIPFRPVLRSPFRPPLP